MTWDVKTELINAETELRKVSASCNGRTFFIKARMKTAEEKKAVWDEIYLQYKDVNKIMVDSIAGEGKTNLERRMP